jgi:uncharacterized protein YcaQ
MSGPEYGREVLNARQILSVQQARNLHLAAQGLLTPARARTTRARVLAAIARMRLLQIDTIHVVARSPYLVLFSRLGHYEPRWLDELLAKGLIFECWAHEACFAPIDDYVLHATQGEARATHWAHKSAQRMQRDHREAMDRILAHICEHGAVKASNFERKQPGGAGWWGWKDEKRWLEACFARGELMICRRENFQRVYDLTERVLAKAKVDTAALKPVDSPREFILGAVRALGIAQARWIADYFRSGKKYKDSEMESFVDAGDLIRVPVRGWDVPGYVHRDHLPLLQRAQRGALRATHTSLLSPFDPVVWDRARASALFDFNYTIECYTPGHKRRFGYFVLPILHRGRLIGRLDAKAHRAEGLFEVKALFLEEGVTVDARLIDGVAQAIQACADWHATPRVVVRRSEPVAFGKSIRSALKESKQSLNKPSSQRRLGSSSSPIC